MDTSTGTLVTLAIVVATIIIAFIYFSQFSFMDILPSFNFL